MVVTRKSLHKIVLNKICEEMSYATATSPTQKLPYGTMQRILKQYTKDHPWLNRDKINFHYRKFKTDPLRCALNVPVIDTGSDISAWKQQKNRKLDQKLVVILVDSKVDQKEQLKLQSFY